MKKNFILILCNFFEQKKRIYFYKMTSEWWLLASTSSSFFCSLLFFFSSFSLYNKKIILSITIFVAFLAFLYSQKKIFFLMSNVHTASPFPSFFFPSLSPRSHKKSIFPSSLFFLPFFNITEGKGHQILLSSFSSPFD